MAESSFFEYIRKYLLDIAPIVICFIPATIISSYVKARIAYYFGDSSAKVAGRMSLWPVHFDILGTISMLMFYPGWASPVPVNLTNLKQDRKKIVWVELGGVASCFVLGLATLLLLWIFKSLQPLLNLDLRFFTRIFEFFATFNIFFAIFNLIPLPPLAGFRILVALLYHKPQGVLDSKLINVVGSIIIMILFIWTPLTRIVIGGTKLFTGIVGSSGEAYFSYFANALFNRGL